jgi:sugar phosphate isomerase/epimerase
MLQDKLGIGSFAYRYHVGIPGCMPESPMKPMDFINESARLGLRRIQLCENLNYVNCSEPDILRMAKRTKELGLIVEIGMNGASKENLRKHIHLAQIFGSKFIRVVIGDIGLEGEYAVDAVTNNLNSTIHECRGAGIEIGLENHFDLPTPQIMRIIHNVHDPLVGSVFDSTNCINFLERPEETLDYMLPCIKSAHLKDFRMVKTEAGITLRGQILGQGIIDSKSLVKKILSNNPNASIIIELTIRRENGIPVSDVIAKEKCQIEQSVAYAKILLKN